MADMGFLPQVDWVLRRIEGRHQTMLFSATLDGDVDRLVRRHLHGPGPPRGGLGPADGGVDGAPVPPGPPDGQGEGGGVHLPRTRRRCIVFVRTKRGADRLVEQLEREGVRAAAIHGDLRQANREKALEQFASGRLHVLVATDVAARGLDIDDVDVVVHYDPPEDHKAYLHRSGPHGARRGHGRGRHLGAVEPDPRGRAHPEAPRAPGPDRRGLLQRPPSRPTSPGGSPTRARPEAVPRSPRRGRRPDAGRPRRRRARSWWSPRTPTTSTSARRARWPPSSRPACDVAYCIVTDGDAGGSDLDQPRHEMAALRRDEQRAAAAEVGVDDVTFLGYPDGRLVPSIELRRDISRQIRRVRPDGSCASRPSATGTASCASHPDHLAAGEAAAVRGLPRRPQPLRPSRAPRRGLRAPHRARGVADGRPASRSGRRHHRHLRPEARARCAATRARSARASTSTDLLRGWNGPQAVAAGLPEGRFAETFRAVVTA